MSQRPNILFILLDATRSDYCSAFGYPKESTPNLDKLATQGVHFNQAISPAPWTLPSIASVFTGHYPSETQIYPNLRLDESYPTLAELLSYNGYTTYLSTMNSWLSQPFGLQRGFDTVNKQWQLIQTKKDINKLVAIQEEANGNLYQTVLRQVTSGNPLTNAVNLAYYKLFAYRKDTGAHRVLPAFQRWMKKQKKADQPWFAFVHYLEAHLEYKPPQDWVERHTVRAETRLKSMELLQLDQWRMAWRHMAGVEMMPEENLTAWKNLYEIEVRYTDYYMGQLIDWLRSIGELDNTMVVIIADHGENLGEHNLYNHQYCIYDTLLHVPYILYWPEQLSPCIVNQQVQTQDVFSTLVEAAGIKNPTDDVCSHLQSDYGLREYVYSEYGQPRLPHQHLLDQLDFAAADLDKFARGLSSVRSNTHKYIVGNDHSEQAYNVETDVYETRNIVDVPSQEIADLKRRMDNWLVDHPIGRVGIREDSGDEEVERRLRDLGYVE